MAVGYPNLCAG